MENGCVIVSMNKQKDWSIEMKVTQKKVVKMVDEIQYEAGDVLVCTHTVSGYFEVGSHYIVLSADYTDDDSLVLTDEINCSTWAASQFNKSAELKFEFELSVKGCGEFGYSGE